MKRLYTMQPPVDMQGSLLTSSDFYVPQSQDGYKVAAWLDDATLDARKELFKTALEKDTQDLAEAYTEMCNASGPEKEKDEDDVEDEEDDDYGQDTFYGGEDEDEDDD